MTTKKTTKKPIRKKQINREEWLSLVAKKLEPVFKDAGFPLGPYRVTCGFPCRNARSRIKRRIGECHSTSMSKDKVAEIFISPVLDDEFQVADVLAHELCHVAANIIKPGCGHKGAFVQTIKAVNMTKNKPTQASAGTEMTATIKGIIGDLGDYPHKALDVNADATKKDKCRLLKVACTSCECSARMTRKWLEEVGPPICGCGSPMEEA